MPGQREQIATPRNAAARIAAAQHGVVTASQLIREGMSRSAIGRAAQSGWLVRQQRGVYAVGHACLRPEGVWMAAVLAGGEGTALSHRGAGAAWGVRPSARSAIDITVPGSRGRTQPGLTVHRCKLHPDDVTTLDGIPITTVSRTLLDLAEVIPFHPLRRAVERAEELRLFDLNEMHATLARATGRRGQRPLRRVLDDLVDRPTGTRLELEARALDLIRAHDLPTPAVNTLVGPYE
ncbi:MAG TPA: type IV toxin-antitoxin system AbiEi family antitoxin domain-containing protein, partial [Capillimicrobium sp.]